jgi:hypothetical protein
MRHPALQDRFGNRVAGDLCIHGADAPNNEKRGNGELDQYSHE